METLLDESVRLSTELREALTELHETSKQSWNRNHFYRLDRHNAYDYFDVLPKWRRIVSEYLRGLRDQGEYVTYVDICGRAEATSLGANENYSFSLQPLSSFGRSCVSDSNAEESRFRGDIFSARDFNRFLERIRNNGSRPAFVTFEPVAGLESFAPLQSKAGHPRLNRKVAHQILERHVRRVVALLRPGGYLLLGPPFQFEGVGDFFSGKPQNRYESSLYVKALCRKIKCRVEIAATLNGPRWLIRKREAKEKT